MLNRRNDCWGATGGKRKARGPTSTAPGAMTTQWGGMRGVEHDVSKPQYRRLSEHRLSNIQVKILLTLIICTSSTSSEHFPVWGLLSPHGDFEPRLLVPNWDTYSIFYPTKRHGGFGDVWRGKSSERIRGTKYTGKTS